MSSADHDYDPASNPSPTRPTDDAAEARRRNAEDTVRTPRSTAAASPNATGEDQPSDGVRYGLVLLLCLGVCAALPYAALGLPLTDDQRDVLERLQPYREGDALPLASLFEPARQATIAGAVGTAAAPTDDEVMGSAPLPDAAADAPDASVAAHAAELPFPASAYEGLTRRIEGDPAALTHFYESLRALTPGHPGPKARILVYGTSMNGADRLTRTLRHELGAYFGYGGKGFVPMARGWQSQRHKDVRWTHERWRTNVVNRGLILNGRYGLAGVLARNGATGGESEFGTVRDGPVNRRVNRFELYYQEQPEGGDVAYSVDEGPFRTLGTDGPVVRDRVHAIEVPEGPHALRVRAAGGNLRLYGVVMESEQSGVVVDAASLVGAYTRVLLRFDEAHWAEQLRLRQPDLLVFWMGGNDAGVNADLDVPAFQATYVEALRRARAGRPEASCLVMSVLDKGMMVRGQVRSIPRVLQVVAAQRAAAAEAGCAFFDTHAATGGEGTMRRWRANRPVLVISDLGHLTDHGSLVVSTLLLKALLAGYAEHVAAH
ncbi:MAG: GDSL-type esterase/lipase family protein [Polyangiales bacterium]